MNSVKKIVVWIVLLVVLLAGALAGYAWHWSTQPVQLDTAPVRFTVEPGARLRTVANAMNQAGIMITPDYLVLLGRYTGFDTQIKAGTYEVAPNDTPLTLLERMANGDMAQSRLTLVEGWTYQRIRNALREHPDVRQTLGDISDKALLDRLGASYEHPEGLFYPDTFVFAAGTSDIDVLSQSYKAGQALLETLWENRQPGLPLATPYEALVLASIVEKETGSAADRARVAGVFINRLRIGMPLQTDPTVIYGMGDTYQGRIRKKDLQTDTPWNTYTRPGLPPTPIASPGKEALIAALNPEKHDYYYFVARGDGSSEFSKNLNEHNRAVRKFILGR